jgi:hypothetical protein
MAFHIPPLRRIKASMQTEDVCYSSLPSTVCGSTARPQSCKTVFENKATHLRTRLAPSIILTSSLQSLVESDGHHVPIPTAARDGPHAARHAGWRSSYAYASSCCDNGRWSPDVSGRPWADVEHGSTHVWNAGGWTWACMGQAFVYCWNIGG